MTMNLTRIWITKYALTKGIITVLAEVPDKFSAMARFPHGQVWFEGNDWHYSEEAARARVSEMIVAKQIALTRQLQKLGKTDALTISIVEM
jgi:hypothetical protein